MNIIKIIFTTGLLTTMVPFDVLAQATSSEDGFTVSEDSKSYLNQCYPDQTIDEFEFLKDIYTSGLTPKCTFEKFLDEAGKRIGYPYHADVSADGMAYIKGKWELAGIQGFALDAFKKGTKQDVIKGFHYLEIRHPVVYFAGDTLDMKQLIDEYGDQPEDLAKFSPYSRPNEGDNSPYFSFLGADGNPNGTISTLPCSKTPHYRWSKYGDRQRIDKSCIIVQLYYETGKYGDFIYRRLPREVAASSVE